MGCSPTALRRRRIYPPPPPPPPLLELLGEGLAARGLQPHSTEPIRPEKAVGHGSRDRKALLLDREKFTDKVPPRAVLPVQEIKVEVLPKAVSDVAVS